MPKKAAKTRNNGSMTEAQFWAMIRSALRNKSRWWKPITQCKLNGRRAYKGPNKRQKWEYKCNQCKGWFSDKLINVDHIIPAGELSCSQHLPMFVERLFCEVDHLQILCIECHNVKTQKERNNGERKNRKRV